MALYAAAIVLALWYAPFGSALHVVLVCLWLVPQRAAQVRAGRIDMKEESE